MLQSIRDRTHGWIAGIIISLLILSFALWGIHSYFIGNAGNETVAKVNGTDITTNQLSTAYDRMRRQAQMQQGTAYLPADQEDDLKQKALSALINVEVLKQASMDQDYRISTHQVDSFLSSMPELQENGQFSASRFQQLLSSMMFSANDFIELIRTSLLTEQPRLGIIFSSFALPDEVNTFTSLINQKRVIQYAILPTNTVGITVSPAEIQAYYDAHQQDFQTPEQVSIQYVMFTSKDLAQQIHPTDDDLKKYYNENQTTYTLPNEKTAQPFDQVKDKVKNAYVHQQSIERFSDAREKLASVTYEHPESLDAAVKSMNLQIATSALFSKDKGVDKDISSHDNVRAAAFSNDVLNGQNNSDVIQVDPDTLVVLRVKTHEPAAIQPLTVVQNQISDKLKAQAADEATAKLADTIRQKLQTGTKPDQIAQQYHLTWVVTPPTERNATSVNSAILYAAFKLPPPATSMGTTKSSYSIAKVPTGYAIFTVQRVDPGTATGKDQDQVYLEQVQNTDGLLEYELYKQSLIAKANVTNLM